MLSYSLSSVFLKSYFMLHCVYLIVYYIYCTEIYCKRNCMPNKASAFYTLKQLTFMSPPFSHQIKRTTLVDSRTSVTDVKFAPKHMGLMLTTCSADGVVRIYEAPDVMNLSQWSLQHEISSKLSCSCISWNPSRWGFTNDKHIYMWIDVSMYSYTVVDFIAESTLLMCTFCD